MQGELFELNYYLDAKFNKPILNDKTKDIFSLLEQIDNKLKILADKKSKIEKQTQNNRVIKLGDKWFVNIWNKMKKECRNTTEEEIVVKLTLQESLDLAHQLYFTSSSGIIKEKILEGLKNVGFKDNLTNNIDIDINDDKLDIFVSDKSLIETSFGKRDKMIRDIIRGIFLSEEKLSKINLAVSKLVNTPEFTKALFSDRVYDNLLTIINKIKTMQYNLVRFFDSQLCVGESFLKDLPEYIFVGSALKSLHDYTEGMTMIEFSKNVGCSWNMIKKYLRDFVFLDSNNKIKLKEVLK